MGHWAARKGRLLGAIWYSLTFSFDLSCVGNYAKFSCLLFQANQADRIAYHLSPITNATGTRPFIIRILPPYWLLGYVVTEILRASPNLPRIVGVDRETRGPLGRGGIAKRLGFSEFTDIVRDTSRRDPLAAELLTQLQTGMAVPRPSAPGVPWPLPESRQLFGGRGAACSCKGYTR